MRSPYDRLMAFSFDGDPRTHHRRCDQCGEEHDATNGLVLRDGAACAAYWTAWYPHENEAWIDVAFGSFQAPDYADNVTFGCRVGHVEGQAEPACSLVAAAQPAADDAIFGHKLSRDEALAHPLLNEFWEVVDWLIEHDPLLNKHVFHMP